MKSFCSLTVLTGPFTVCSHHCPPTKLRVPGLQDQGVQAFHGLGPVLTWLAEALQFQVSTAPWPLVLQRAKTSRTSAGLKKLAPLHPALPSVPASRGVGAGGAARAAWSATPPPPPPEALRDRPFLAAADVRGRSASGHRGGRSSFQVDLLGLPFPLFLPPFSAPHP